MTMRRSIIAGCLVIPVLALAPPAVLATDDAAALSPADNAALHWWRIVLVMADSVASIDDSEVDVDPTQPPPEPPARATEDSIARTFGLGARAPYCDWGVDSQEGVHALLPHLTRINQLMAFARLRVRWCAQRGEFDAAADAAADALSAAAIVSGRRPLLIEWLLGCKSMRRAVDATARILPRLDAAQRVRLAQRLRILPAMAPATAVLEQEMAIILSEARSLRALPASRRLEEVGRAFNGDPLQGSGGLNAADLAQAQDIVCDANVDDFLAALPREFAWMHAQLDRPLAERAQRSEAPFSTGNRHSNALIEAFVPVFGTLGRAEAQNVITLALLAAAIAWYDAGDAALAQHPDPISGMPFRREMTATGFRLVAAWPRERPIAVSVGEPLSGMQPPTPF